MAGIIPFFRIPKGCRIALYGCGNNATPCYKQLIKSGYCSLAFVVDRDYTDKSLEGQKARPISQLDEMEYDYVLITIFDADISEQVKNILISRGIAEEKIVTMHDRAIPLSTVCLGNVAYMLQYLEDRFSKMNGAAKKAGEYYQELGALLIKDIKDKSFVLNQLKVLVGALKDDKKKFILLILMYQHGYFDKQCMESLMNYMYSVEWYDDTYYWFIVNSTVMVFLHPDYIYNDFFADRKELQRKICEYYRLYDIENNSNNQKGKVAIVTMIYSPESMNDAVSVLVRKYAIEFSDLGYDVRIFLHRNIGCDSDNVFLMESEFPPNDSKRSDKLTEMRNISIVERLDADLSERLQNRMKAIVDYQPSFILDMADGRFPEAFALINHFPIINLPIRGNEYSAEADIYLATDKNRVERDNELFHARPIERVRQIAISYLTQAQNNYMPYKREEYGFKEEDFLMVTVGNRLQLEITDELIESVCILLSDKKNIKWVLVGDNVGSDNTLFEHFSAEGRIINWGCEECLESLYQICNIYLNPDRGGGGVSIRRAMRLGLPIAMTDFPSDALPCMPKAYVIHGGYTALMEYVARLYDDQEFYRRVSKETEKQIKIISDQSDVEKILEIYHSMNTELEQET